MKGSTLTPDELDGLVKRALVSALVAEPTNPMLARAYRQLADLADALHALELRERKLIRPDMPDVPIHPSGFTPEELEAEHEKLQTELQPIVPSPPFRIRPKGQPERLCSICREPQWKTPGGWTCSNGHGGAD